MRYLTQMLGSLTVSVVIGYSIGANASLLVVLSVLFVVGGIFWKLWTDRDGFDTYKALCVFMFFGVILRLYKG